MKVIVLLAALCVAGAAGDRWKVGGRVGLGQSGRTVVPSAAITAEYLISDRLTWRTDLEAQFRDVSHTEDFALRVPTHLLWHPIGSNAPFDPYAGPGASLGMDFEKQVTMGANGVVGFTVRPRNQQSFGLEWRWSWPDLTRSSKGRWDAALTGNWELKF